MNLVPIKLLLLAALVATQGWCVDVERSIPRSGASPRAGGNSADRPSEDPGFVGVDFMGALETSVLRLARGNLVEIVIHWKGRRRYVLEEGSPRIFVVNGEDETVRTVLDVPALIGALNAEREFIRKVSAQKLPSNTAREAVRTMSFEVDVPEPGAGRKTDRFAWLLNSGGRVYSFGLAVPILTNRDLENVYQPLIPHCPAARLDAMKRQFGPLRFLWSCAGVISGEQGMQMFDYFYRYVPAERKKGRD